MRTCNKEHMTLLVTELESGNREQVCGTLRVDDAFCCLGVACEISGVGEWKDEGYQGKHFYSTPNGENCNVLPVDVMDWLGIDRGNPDEWQANQLYLLDEHGGYEETGSDMNDNGYTFAEIAVRIRNTYLGDEDGTNAEV